MRDKIAIFMGDVTSSIQEIVMKTMISHANSLGYDTVFICTYGSYNDDYLYSEGERALIYLPDFSEFAGIIIAEDLLDIEGMPDELYKVVTSTSKCPIVYFRTIREGCYSILTHNTKAMEDMTRHFIEEHGFTDLCYMSGKQGHLDTKERLNGFLNVMREHNLPVTEHTIFHGDYWREKGPEAVDWFMEGRDKYPQAIICANDYMALSICDELNNRGVRVPEDVCVSGYDYIDEARNHAPSLTSVEVDFAGMAIDAVNVIDRVLKGEEVERFHYNVPKIHYHNSCCGNQVVINDISRIIEDNYLHIAAAKKLMLSVTEYQDAFDEDEYFHVADKYHSIVNDGPMWLCVCDENESGYTEIDNDTKFSDLIVLKRIFQTNKPGEATNIKFDRKKLLPDEMWSDTEFNNYLFFCIHYKNRVYGYAATILPSRGWFQVYMQAYYINLANAMEDARVQKELANLEEMKNLYYKDPLTGILNRRGFDKQLREKFEKFTVDGVSFGIASVDMDGLKYINDNYGHNAGDEAIKRLSTALERTITETEFCARVGGDEFAAYIDTGIPDRIKTFKENFYKEIEQLNEEKKGNRVGASIGICDLAENPKAPLILHIRKADVRMYEDKRKRKSVDRLRV